MKVLLKMKVLRSPSQAHVQVLRVTANVLIHPKVKKAVATIELIVIELTLARDIKETIKAKGLQAPEAEISRRAVAGKRKIKCFEVLPAIVALILHLAPSNT